MSNRKTLFTALMLLLFLGSLTAQNTNSPYSRFGLGALENPAMGRSRAMGGIGYGLRDNLTINPLNPASYSAVDTLNFVFDFGLSSSFSFFGENGNSQVNPNGKFDYLAMKIPFKKYWGVTLGITPFSNVGYEYKADGTTAIGSIDYTESFVGTGGLNTFFLGTGISLGKNLSLGTNLKYVFGMLSNASSVSYKDATYNSYNQNTRLYLGAPSVDLGAQYKWKVGQKGTAILGANYTLATPFTFQQEQTIRLTPSIDTVTTTTYPTFDLPTTLGVGASYCYDGRLTLGFDYQNQAWSKARFYDNKGDLSNNVRYAIGMEYLPALIATSYFKAVKYRFGMNYTDTYYQFSDGTIKNAGLSLGFGLPFRGQKSTVNLSFEAGKLIVPHSCNISENYFKVSLDVSFNERWFYKRKL